MQPLVLEKIEPTPFLKDGHGRLRQLVRLTVRNPGATAKASIAVAAEDECRSWPLGVVQAGLSVHEVYLEELSRPGEVLFVLDLDGVETDRRAVAWQPPRHWVVVVVQLSHHDVGYTDLASHVVPEHDRWLDAAIDMAAATRDFDEDARFRIVVEQAWSIDHFLRHAAPERVKAMIELLRQGSIEVTALFGNMTTELCGHETLARSVYHAFRLKREFGVPIVSAEHNDIPGFCWGLSQVLTEAGIRIICPGLPKYYSWGNPGAPSFWDEATIFGAEGMPGAFWWEAPSGKRVLFWCNNQGCGGGADPALSDLAARLTALEQQGYPYPVLRWPVSGGARDNSPYIEGYAHTIRAWNEQWAYPRLVSGTNARFHEALLPHLPDDLPLFRGETPGQDYPAGAASTAAATAVNRRNHTDLPAAEALATVATELTNGITDGTTPAERWAPAETIAAAYEEVLWHDEHTWGHHFPAGPTASAAELEKALHAHRAAALTHDVAAKAMARIADAVHLDQPGIHLVVFNPLLRERSGLVTTPLRELDNCGSTMVKTEQGTLRGVLLHDRWHVNPPPEITAGHFDLVDVAAGEMVPFQIEDLQSPFGPEPYAAQRLGLGAGGKRYGFFEQPAGLLRNLVFHSAPVPALGYRTYRLRPRADRPVFPCRVEAEPAALESPFYRLELDPETGFARRLVDKETGTDLIAGSAPHPFGAVLVRSPHGVPESTVFSNVRAGASGPLTASLRVTGTALGHPRIEMTYTLYACEKRLDVAVGMLKDPTPLLETYVAFPFAMPDGRFRYEVPLCVVDPGRDLMPGAYADRLAVQNWVAVSDGDRSILWSSHDAPVVSVARLWPGRVSPAHSAVVREDLRHPCQTAQELRGGAIYSLLTANNFGTNFAVSQNGHLVFRYSLTSVAGELTDGEAAGRAREALTPLSTLFTKHPGRRPLPPAAGFMTVEPADVQMLALKCAEDGTGLILRLWNPQSEKIPARIATGGRQIGAVRLTNLAEEDTGPTLEHETDAATVLLAPKSVVTLRVTLLPLDRSLVVHQKGQA